MQTVAITIQGVSPLIMNKFTDASMLAAEGKPTAFQGDKGTPRQQAERRVYTDEQGIVHIPGPNIFRAIIDAGTFHKAGKSKITTQKTSLVPAAIGLRELTCPITAADGSAPKMEVDSRSVVIPATGGRIMCHRPRFDTWAMNFTLEVDTTMFGMQLVRQLVDDAGKRIGLGDFRPSRKGPFGRFVVTRWKAETQKASA